MSPVSNTSRRTTSSQQQTKNYAAMVPPQALELERTVLGALLLEKDAFAITQQYLRPNFFYLDSHKHIYQAMVNLAVRQEPIDYYSVIEELKIARTTLDNYEAYKTKPDIETAKKMAKLYGLSVDDIIFLPNNCA